MIVLRNTVALGNIVTLRNMAALSTRSVPEHRVFAARPGGMFLAVLANNIVYNPRDIRMFVPRSKKVESVQGSFLLAPEYGLTEFAINRQGLGNTHTQSSQHDRDQTGESQQGELRRKSVNDTHPPVLVPHI